MKISIFSRSFIASIGLSIAMSWSTGLSAMECPFCNNFAPHIKSFERLYSDIIDKDKMILMQSDHFNVVSDNYPVAYGHLLIIPKNHTTSFATIDLELSEELSLLIFKLQELFGAEDYILFEHGCRAVEEKIISSGNSVFHAHLHFIPNTSLNKTEAANILFQYGLRLKSNSYANSLIYPGDAKLLDFLKQNTYCSSNGTKYFDSYLFLKYSKDDAFVIPESLVGATIPSQFFRKIFANTVNNQSAFWDWKNEINQQVKDLLKSRLLYCFDKIK